MKRLHTLLFLLLSCAALLIAGCGKDGGDDKGDDTPTTYKINLTADAAQGSAKAEVDGAKADKAEEGATVTLTATAESGYKFTKWTVTGVTLTDAAANPATFTMPAKNINITAEFEAAASATLSVDLDPLTVNFPAVGDTRTYIVTTNQPSWDCLSDQTWCKVEKDVNAQLQIYVDSHTSTTAPTPAKVTVTAGDAKPVVITVTQDAYVPPAPTSKAVYVAGTEKIDGSFYAMQWKYQDGTVTGKQLSTAAGSEARSVCTDGTNVYVGGRDVVQPNSVWTATVWKNGTAITQAKPDGARNSEVGGVCLGKDGKVYAVGYYSLSGDPYACVWIDGVLDTTFPVVADTRAQHIACASDGTIYVLGKKITWIGGTGYETLQLWKNGDLQSGYLTDYVYSNKNLFVAGTDVHVVATKDADGNNISYHWKNGVRQTLQYTDIDSNDLYAVYVQGADVYVSGYHKKIWKNGIRSSSQFNIDHFAVASDGTFYAATEFFYEGKFIHTGALADALTPVALPSGNDGIVNGIFLVE